MPASVVIGLNYSLEPPKYLASVKKQHSNWPTFKKEVPLSAFENLLELL